MTTFADRIGDSVLVGVAAGAALPMRGSQDETGLFARMLDEIDYGVALVNIAGQLRYANQLAWRAFAGTLAVRVIDGNVHATQEADQATLRQALIEAGRGLRRLLTLGAAGRRSALAVVPMGGDAIGDEGLAMLVFGKQPASETLTLDFFARTHRLTAAEVTVLHGLCAGERPKEIAKKIGVAISTVRTQIGSIRIKTQTGSIRELVNRVAALPPITPAMKTAVCH
jgi:DNA-binding CsgD family transcriptional regulator